MAETKSKAYVRVLEDGTHELGAEINGAFVSFASHPQSYVDTIVRAAANAEEGDGEDEPGA